MKKLSIIALVLLSLISIDKANASHLMGADITWTCVGQDSFLIKLVVYRDCNGITLGVSPINFKCTSSGASITSLSINIPTPIDITPVCNTSCTRCQSLSCSFPYGIHRYTMEAIAILNSAGTCCNITISWDQSARNGAITTIPNASSYDLYIEAQLNRCLNPCDNSPSFTNPPIAILCTLQDFAFNNGALDTDMKSTGGLSDSLTYEWAHPMSAAGTNLIYSGQYDFDRAIYFWGFPSPTLPYPRGLHLDPHTGDIQFRPMKAEVTVMVLQVNEFRNGTKIAEIRRDLQIIVMTCTGNSPPSISTPNNVRSKSVCVGTPVSFTFTTSDPNTNDTLLISWNNAIPGATWTDNNGQTKNPTATLTWTPANTQAGSLPYTFTVTAKDNACPNNAQFTQSYQIFVNPVPQANIIISDSGCGKYFFKAVPINVSSPTYKWSSDSFTFSPDTLPLVSHTFSTGYYPVKLVMNTPGCSQSFYDTAFIAPYMSVYLPADTVVYTNSTLSIQAKVANVTGPYSLQWGTGKNTKFPGDTTLVKHITVTKDTTLWIRATYSNFNCPFDEIRIKVHPLSKIILPNDTALCSLNYSISPRVSPNISVFRSFKWYRQGSSQVVDSDAHLNVSDTGLFICVAVDTFGYSSSDSVHIHLNPIPVIKINPIDKRCINGTVIDLNGFVTVDGIYKPGGIWSSQSAGLTFGYKFNPLLAGVSTLPGWKVKYAYTNPSTGCYNKDSGYITIYPIPKPYAGKDDSICPGSKIPLSGTPSSSQGKWRGIGVEGSYPVWKFNPDTSGITDGGSYDLIYQFTDNNQCANEDTLRITVFQTPVVKAGNPLEFCLNAIPVYLSGNPAGGAWTGKGVAGNKFYPKTATSGLHLLTYTYTNVICTESDQVMVLVYPKVPTPVISFSPTDYFLECNLSNGSYEWFYRTDTSSAPITISNTSRRIKPKIYCQNCYFSVQFTDSISCMSDTSALFHFQHNSIDNNYPNPILKFYPNPAHDLLFTEFSGNNPVNLRLTNILGNTILETKIIPGKNLIHVQNDKPGIYFIFLDGMIAGKVLIE